MRIDKLWIKDFKNLKDFEIDFDENQMTTVLIGRNGTGKSNLIEAIVIIFSNFSTSLIFKPIFFNPGQPKHLYGSTAPPHGLKTTKLRLYSKN